MKRLREADINEQVLKYKGLDALKNVADGRATKIYMPSDITELVTKAGVISEAMGIGDSTPIDHSPKAEKPLEEDPCIDEETSEEGRIAAHTTAEIKRSLEE